METRCQVCAQQATKKCTGCGEVFCDLHVRYAGEAGGTFGGSQGLTIGYYCDACWERMTKQRRGLRGVLVAVGVVLLVVNVLGLLAFQGTIPVRSAPIAIAIVVLGLLAVVGATAIKRR